jgi:acyl dehydratase
VSTETPALVSSFMLDCITAKQVERYAEASGDRNPIHLSWKAAQEAGLDAPIVHGAFIIGQFEKLLRVWRPKSIIRSMSVQFVAPLPVGSSLQVSGRVASSCEVCTIRLAARSQAKLVAVGHAVLT